MRWRYEYRTEDGNIVEYAYSCESDQMDGVISFDKSSGIARIVKPCVSDKTERRKRRSLSHFYSVVSEGFPRTKSVCCG